MAYNTTALKIIQKLKKAYPDAHCSLHYKTPFELLVAVVLSAQCTDERVNQVTPALFERFPNAHAMGKGSLKEIESLIRSTGFFKNKALALKSIGHTLDQEYAGKVPDSLDELVALRGVGRKTANVVLGEIYNRPAGIVVDTHVGRLSRRMGLTRHKDPVKVEQDLSSQIPQKEWRLLSHLFIEHGRAVCSARHAPLCDVCVVSKLCKRVGVR